MNKILRYVLLSFLAIMTTVSYATIKTVTFDFDNDYATIFSTITGVSSNDSNAGDFPADGVLSADVDGITLAIAAAEGAKNPNRLWSSSPRLRMYSGYFILTATRGDFIKKIEFDAPKFNLTPLDGTLTEKVWTGNVLGALTFTVGGNTQIKKMVVTLGGENDSLEGGESGEGGEGGETSDNPLAKFMYKSGTVTESADGNQVLVDYVALNADAEITGKMTFDFENSLCSKLTMTATFPTEEMAKLYYDDTVKNKEKEGIETVAIDGKTVTVTMVEGYKNLSKTVIKSLMKMMVDNETGGIGTQESPLTPNQANLFAGTLDKGAVSEEDIYVKGKIASIKYTFNADKGTATFFISADGKDDFTFQCYSVNFLENKGWVEGNTQIQVGDEVIVCGKVTNYNGTTPETASKKAYVYSLNGVTKNDGGSGGTETPTEEVKTVSVAEFNAAEESTSVWYQLTGVVKNLKDNDLYGNFDLEDETGSVYVYGLLSEKGGAKKLFQELAAAKGIQNGSKITIIGNRGSYKDKIEVMNAYFVSIEEAAQGLAWNFTQWSEATIANLKADAAASKLEGWSDVEKKADAEAGADPTEASKDNCFWSVAEPNADGEMTANGVVIAELKGLKFYSVYSTARSLAIAVNYPSTSLGDYAGPSYLWLGGGKKKVPCFAIPSVAAGSTITMEVESHKPAEGRGVELYAGLSEDGKTVDDATKIGDTFNPTAKEAHSWTIQTAGDVIVYNTNGCHIYTIKVEAGDPSGISTVKAQKLQSNAIYNLAGQKVGKDYKGIVIVNGRKFMQK